MLVQTEERHYVVCSMEYKGDTGYTIERLRETIETVDNNAARRHRKDTVVESVTDRGDTIERVTGVTEEEPGEPYREGGDSGRETGRETMEEGDWRDRVIDRGNTG